MNLFSMDRNEILKNIPELRELAGVVENNTWHLNDDVLDHTLTVFNRLKENFKLNFVSIEYFDQKVGELTRKELLAWATLFHDIAKPDTYTQENGTTKCPNHEELGAKKAEIILKRYLPNPQDHIRAVRIIQHHGVPHNMFTSDEQVLLQNTTIAKQEYADIFIDLLLLGLSDTEGAQLAQLNPQELAFRTQKYHQILQAQ